MAKKKQQRHSKGHQKKSNINGKKKLPRGYKQCGNCKELLNIHKYLCNFCGHKHEMKKRKVEIMKNLNKITPKLARSLIQLNDFNNIEGMIAEHEFFVASPLKVILKPENKQIKEVKKRKSKSTESSSNGIILNELTKNKQFVYHKFENALIAICPLLDDVIFIQSLEKIAIDQPESEKITIKAYNLEKYTKINQRYDGKVNLHYLSNKRLLYKILINDHVLQMKSIQNRVGLLTGQYTIIVIDLEVNLINERQDHNYEIESNEVEIKVGANDKITCFQWLRWNKSARSVRMMVGTLMGDLYVYEVLTGVEVVVRKTVNLWRYIPHAHHEYVTAMAECPLIEEEECLFATGSYDGNVAIWSLNSLDKIYNFEAANRKISCLVWDSGAKFLYISRDQASEDGLLACFFSLGRNQEESMLILSNQLETRNIRGNSNNAIVHHDSQSLLFSIVDVNAAIIRIMPLEELRKLSLKRKKSKKEENLEKSYQLSFDHQEMNATEILADEANEAEKKNQLPIISSYCHTKVNKIDYIYGVTYHGFLWMKEISEKL